MTRVSLTPCMGCVQSEPVRPRPCPDALLSLPRCLERHVLGEHDIIPVACSEGDHILPHFCTERNSLMFFAGMALAPWKVLASGKFRTDAEEKLTKYSVGLSQLLLCMSLKDVGVLTVALYRRLGQCSGLKCCDRLDLYMPSRGVNAISRLHIGDTRCCTIPVPGG